MRACVLWLTGLPCSGKSTLAEEICKTFFYTGRRFASLDGDHARTILGNTGFSEKERETHIKYMGFTAKCLQESGITAVCSFVSPCRKTRDWVRGICSNFIEIYVNPSPLVCEQRDVKGMWAKARAGEIQNFTGVSANYEPPTHPEITVDTHSLCLDDSMRYIMEELRGQI